MLYHRVMSIQDKATRTRRSRNGQPRFTAITATMGRDVRRWCSVHYRASQVVAPGMIARRRGLIVRRGISSLAAEFTEKITEPAHGKPSLHGRCELKARIESIFSEGFRGFEWVSSAGWRLAAVCSRDELFLDSRGDAEDFASGDVPSTRFHREQQHALFSLRVPASPREKQSTH